MATGWVPIHRELSGHWVWNEKPFSKGQAWVDLILAANHEVGKTAFDGGFIEIERGCLLTSEVKLASRWGWSRKKVHRFLELLEADSMLSRCCPVGVPNMAQKGAYLRLCNYEDWQITGTAKEQARNRSGTGEEQAKHTNNKNNKNNNDKKVIKNIGDIITEYTEDEILREVLREFASYRAKGKSAFTPHAMKLITINLDKLARTPSEKVDILNQSIERGWTGVFAIKSDFAKTPYKKETNVDRARKILFGEEEPHEPSRNEEIVILDDNDMA